MNMSRFGDTEGIRTRMNLLIFVQLFFYPALVYCGDFEIPGPHFPIAAGAPGSEIIKTGNVPEFLSYRAKDQNGEDRVYVPVFSAVVCDAGESNEKDVRQNFDKSITIHGNKVFWCAFGHPYRQFAFQEKYKWDIIKQGIDKKVNIEKIPLKPLIRSFLVEERVVKDIMLKATTEAFNEIASDLDINVDKRATNQFGISNYSKRKLEMAALPGSLVTYADFEDLKELDKYPEVTKEWGEIRKVAELKQQFGLPTEVFTPPESSFFITTDKNNVAKIADHEVVKSNMRNEEMIDGKKVDSRWKEYASVLEKMNNVPEPTDANQLTMLKLQTRPISEYKVDFTDNTVKSYLIKQNLNSQHLTGAKQLLDSFEVLKVATKRQTLPWFLLVSPVDLKVTEYKKLRELILSQCTNIIAGNHDSQSIKVLRTEMKNNNIQWKFSPSVDNYEANLKSAVDFLKRKGQLTDFPTGEKFTKPGLIDYYKHSLKKYVLSAECKLSNDEKNFIKQTVDGSLTAQNIVFTTEENSGSKIFLGADVSNRQFFMPEDQLSIEIFDKDIGGDQIKDHLSKLVDMTSYISPPKKVTLMFPDSDLGKATEHLWKKRATELGEYLKSSMEVQKIEIKFRHSKSLKYDMISHTIELGQGKEMPVRLVNGHLIIDDHIAPFEVVKEIQNTYDNSKVGHSFRSLLEAKQSDIVFVPNAEGFFLSNTNHDSVLKSPLLIDYGNKQFKKPIRNEIIIALDQDMSIDDKNLKHVHSVADEAANMLYDGFRHKNKDRVMLLSASIENNRWNINKILPVLSDYGIGKYDDVHINSGSFDDVRITVVGKGHSSSKHDVLEIAGQNSKEINNLIEEIKATYDIKEKAVQKVSIVACNPETTTSKSKDVNRAIKLGKEIAEENKVTVSTRVGYVKVDEEGHKWFAATENGDYHRRQSGDVYIAEWDGTKVISGVSKVPVKAEEFLKDTDIKKSNHLGISKTVSNEFESEIFKDGLLLQEELKNNIRSQNINAETIQLQGKTIFDNPKMQKRLQKLGNIMSKYGMLQTASFLVNAEKCKHTNYSSAEVCEARKSIAIMSLTQEATELVSGALSKSLRGGPPKVKTFPKAGTASLKSFGKSLMRNPLKGLPILGVGLDGVSLGLDIYDLTKAKTPTEKGIAGTNVALSGLSFIAGATALGASLLGFTAVAAFAGPAAIVVGALSFLFNIGVTIWQTIKYEKTNIPLVNKAAEYFETMHTVYDQQWYDCKESTAFFRPGIAVKELSFISYTIEANSEYLCETKRNNWKFHAKIYPLLLGSQFCEDYDSVESNCYCNDLDCSGLINIRSGMNIDGTQHFDCSNVKTVFLNTTPVILQDYSYAYFDEYDPVIGLESKDPETWFQDTGHNLGRMIDHNNYNFDYYYHFCFDKYAIINGIGFKRYIPSTTTLELGNEHINIFIPAYEDSSLVTFFLHGYPGTGYSVHPSRSCTVHIKRNPGWHFTNDQDQTLWKIVIDIDLVELACEFHSGLQLNCVFHSTKINVDNTKINQVIFIDKHNILSLPLLIDSKWMLLIAEVHGLKFSSEKEFLQIINRYLTHDFIDLPLTYTPVRSLCIKQCGDNRVPKSYVSRLNDGVHLHFTSEFPGNCSDKLNTDAKLHELEMDDSYYYSSTAYSLAWQTHATNNSLKSLVILPCHSEIRNDINISAIEGNVYITQKLSQSRFIDVEITYRLTDYRVYLLTITSDYHLSWDNVYALCFVGRPPIFSNQEQLRINRSIVLAGKNDLTFVNTSSELYWVRKKDGNVLERIIPNLDITCSSVDISFPDFAADLIEEKQCGGNNTRNSINNTQIYYFLCRNGNKTQFFVQSGNNQATLIEDLDNQQIYFDGNDILIKNASNVFSFEDGSPSGVCLYEYEMHLPYEKEESLETFMIRISQEYECVESKVKLKFGQLVGWFDYEEMIAVIVHKSISSYKLNALGAATEPGKYWMFDTVNGSLYIQETAESSLLFGVIVGNVTETEYLAMIPVSKLVVANVQQVNYENGRMYAFTSDGATYLVHANGKQEILAVTDFWFAQHPEAQRDLQKETKKEVVLYRPDTQHVPANIRCKRSIVNEQGQFNKFLLYHIPFGVVYNVDIEESVFLGSNHKNMTLYTYNFKSKALIEIDRYGTVLGQDRYNIIHRINDQTLIVETNKHTENSVPPIIDNVKTIVLSVSETNFVFDLTELCWSQFDEILLSEGTTTSKLTVNLDMLPCDYVVEKVDDRVVLVDYANRKKLVIPNAEERSMNGEIELYVCGERINLHDTSNHPIYIYIIISAVVFLALVIIVILVVWRRRRQCQRISKKSAEEMFVPNEQELQLLHQTAVQSDHTERAKQKASVVMELKQTSKAVINHKRTEKYEHRILRRDGADATSC